MGKINTMCTAAWTEPPNHIKGLPLLYQTMEISCLPVSIDLTHLTMKSTCKFILDSMPFKIDVFSNQRPSEALLTVLILFACVN